jgi:hypothetical protein
LEKIKTFAGVKNTTSSFSVISTLYDLRKEKKGNANAQKNLDKAFDYFVSMQPDKAKQVLSDVK